MYISRWENSRGHPDNVSFMQFSTKIDGFEQKDSQGFENSYNSYEQYPLEKFLIFTIYRNYTLALNWCIVFIYMILTLIYFYFLLESLGQFQALVQFGDASQAAVAKLVSHSPSSYQVRTCQLNQNPHIKFKLL